MGNVVPIVNRDVPQCTAPTGKGTRCRFNAKPGIDVCGHHEKKLAQPVDPEELDDSEDAFNKLSLSDKIKAAEQQVMDLVPVAMQTVMEILANPDEKAADRLKAAQLVLDRGVAQKIQAEVSQTDERDLDDEIEDALAEVRAELDRTGTDG